MSQKDLWAMGATDTSPHDAFLVTLRVFVMIYFVQVTLETLIQVS